MLSLGDDSHSYLALASAPWQTLHGISLVYSECTSDLASLVAFSARYARIAAARRKQTQERRADQKQELELTSAWVLGQEANEGPGAFSRT